MHVCVKERWDWRKEAQRAYFSVDGTVGESILTSTDGGRITEWGWQFGNLISESIGKGPHSLFKWQEKKTLLSSTGMDLHRSSSEIE